MVQFTETLFPTIRQLHGETFDAAMSSIRSNSTSPSLNGAIQDIELALLAFKCLSKMLTYGFKEPSSNEAAKVSYSALTPIFTAGLNADVRYMSDFLHFDARYVLSPARASTQFASNAVPGRVIDVDLSHKALDISRQTLPSSAVPRRERVPPNGHQQQSYRNVLDDRTRRQ